MEVDAPDIEHASAERTPWWPWFLLIGVAAGLGFLGYRAYPAHHPVSGDAGFIDSIFANNLVLFAARLTLFSAALVLAFTAAYVIYSIWKGMTTGRTLTRFGPFEMQAVEDLSEEVEMWKKSWLESNEENDQLRQRLRETDALFQRVYEEWREATTDPDEDDNPA